MVLSNKKLTLTAAIFITFSLGIGFIIGYFSARTNRKTDSNRDKLEYYNKLIEDLDQNGLEYVLKEINSNNIREYLKNITYITHQAGTPNDLISANYIYDSFKSFGLDKYELFDYDVLLDFPDDNKYNNIELKTSNLKLEKLYEIKEPVYDNDGDKNISKPFLAYAKSGSATSDELYFANYCMEDDFEHLIEKGFNLTDKLVICKYGKIFRGNKVQIAEKYRIKGLLLYDDPLRAAPQIASDLIYPNGEFLPRDGVQRGTVILSDGDPLTPFYPSNDYGYRLNESDILIPKIPAQVIGYGLAYELFKLIENNQPVVNKDWIGEFNITYTYGGKLKDSQYLTLNVFNKRDIRKTYNVMGIIEGSIEPDRYVMIGNHRDSWTLGALDPSSGTAVLIELARALMKLKNENKWKPKRSVLFLSWGAEEYGLIGSVEWVEEYQKKLTANSVAYLNIDTLIKGNYSFHAEASPLLYDIIYQITSSIKQTYDETVFDRWLKNDPNKDNTLPYISPYLGSGSDYMSFQQRVGIPCIDQGFMRDRNNKYYQFTGMTSYATYHSSYETFKLVSEILDPNFETFRLIGVIVGELLRRLSESLILPFNVSTYSIELKNELKNFENSHKMYLNDLNINLDQLKYSIENFTQTAYEFNKRLESIDKSKYHLVRIFNEQLRSVEKAFLDSSGRQRSGYDHMIYAPSISDAYGSDAFPSITDAIYNQKKDPQSAKLIENIKYQLSIVIYSIQSASSILKEPTNFKRYV